MKFLKLFFFTVLLVLNNLISAQEVSMDGEFRINPVYSLGFRKPMYSGDKAGIFTMQRTRLIINYKKDNDMDAEVILQDRRFWGDQSDRDDVPNIALYRGWVEKHFKQGLSLRLGRQGLVYDNEYLLGDPNWVGTRAHDAALLKFEQKTFKAHLGVAYNANGQELVSEPYQYNLYKNMAFLWMHKDLKKLQISLIGIHRGMEKKDSTKIFYMTTFGPDIKMEINKNLSFVGLFYYQIGQTTARQNVEAFFYSAQLKYNMNKFLSFNLGMDVGSGTNQNDLQNKENKAYHTFDRHYGLIHGHFGYIDYFYVNQPTLCGIADYYLKTKINVSDRFSIEDHVHYFETQAKLNDPLTAGKPLDNYLGTENDILLNYKFSNNFKASFGHSMMFGTKTLDAFFGGKPSKSNQVFYFVITANTNFFKFKKEQEKPTI